MLKVLQYFLAMLFGILVGLGLLFLIAGLPLQPDHKLYKIFGIKKPQVIGFQPFWLLERADKDYGNYITTLTYFGLTLDSDGTIIKLVNPQEEEPGWTTLRLDDFQARISEAQKKNLKTSLLVFNANEASISALLKEPQKHAENLVADIEPIMKKHNFSDLNLDIESFKEASQSAQEQYTIFVKEVKKEMEKKNLGTLTIEVTPISLVQPRLTNVEALGEIADYIILMAYDYHYLYSFVAGPVAPVAGVPEDRELDVQTALDETLNLVPPEKVILGIPLYGYSWETLSDKPGGATIPEGGSTASNRRVEEMLAIEQDCSQSYDQVARQPYLICSNGDYFKQIYYEDEQSIKEKLKLAQDYKIAGVALWALGYEGEAILNPIKDFKNSFDFNPPLGIID